MSPISALKAACLSALFALSPAAVRANDIVGGLVERRLLTHSEALGRDIAYSLYRPAAEPRDGETWPTLFLLEGRPSETDWLDQGDVQNILDRAIADGVIPPMLVVMPVAPHSWYVDNPDPGGQGRMKTAIARDLRSALERRFPLARCREARAVAGLSMGGYGALLFALDEPDVFGAGVSLSGAIAPPMAAEDEARAVRADRFYDRAFGAPLARERFNAWNLFGKAEALRQARETPAIFLAIGDRDRAGLLQSTALLHAQLARAGVDSSLRVGPGGHDWEVWKRDLAAALEWLGPRLDPGCGGEIASHEGAALR
ncbi:esterase [Methylopila jiangsuensis]|uniref:Esterase n=1 Tax=Methylopila jiangsuensis TaxID=586230 RepID=A0A9W6JIU8_9HYPH|nr:alpha/beta hydrolase family protein [Methylopila jiangsuensis]MDR6286465.1 enterochelin esterase family protein [Methylopila jiangsuensis]GLK77196.1 esterase [Methylopila jiangsuensis]